MGKTRRRTRLLTIYESFYHLTVLTKDINYRNMERLEIFDYTLVSDSDTNKEDTISSLSSKKKKRQRNE